MSSRSDIVLRRIARSVLAIAVLPAAACYHQVVETGRPASPTVIDKPWQMSFVYGIVPPPVLSSASQCPGGVAKVETQHSFLNGVVAAITFGILTPMQVTITCAAGGAAGGSAASSSEEAVDAGRTPAEQVEAITRAADRSSESGRAVLVQF